MSIDQTIIERFEFIRKSFEDTYKRQLNDPAYTRRFMISTATGRYGTDPCAKMPLCIRVNVQSVSEETRTIEEVLEELKEKLPEHYNGIPVVMQKIEMPQTENE